MWPGACCHVLHVKHGSISPTPSCRPPGRVRCDAGTHSTGLDWAAHLGRQEPTLLLGSARGTIPCTHGMPGKHWRLAGCCAVARALLLSVLCWPCCVPGFSEGLLSSGQSNPLLVRTSRKPGRIVAAALPSHHLDRRPSGASRPRTWCGRVAARTQPLAAAVPWHVVKARGTGFLSWKSLLYTNPEGCAAGAGGVCRCRRGRAAPSSAAMPWASGAARARERTRPRSARRQVDHS